VLTKPISNSALWDATAHSQTVSCHLEKIMRYISSTLTILILSVLSVSSQSIDTSYKNFSDTAFSIGDKILTPSIWFEFDGGHNVREVSYDSVKVIADFLLIHTEIIIQIGVHTDSRGTEEYNRKHSKHQAQNVIRVLNEQFNIPIDRLTTEGYGEDHPLEDCSKNLDCSDLVKDCPCHQRNRRVEVKIIES